MNLLDQEPSAQGMVANDLLNDLIWEAQQSDNHDTILEKKLQILELIDPSFAFMLREHREEFNKERLV